MSDYTPDDFARVNLATKGDYMVARRCGAERTPWAIFLNNRPVLYVTDANMVLHNWTPVVEAGPITLDALAAAWEASDEATEGAPIREGDVVIVRHGGGFTVEPADRILSGQTHGRERILSRAPKPREPWRDLADDLRVAKVDDLDMFAQYLHDLGWRKVGDGS